jgi:hypothetical protein
MQTYKLQETIHNASYKEQCKNTRYREHYQIPVTVNNANILITGSKTKIPVTVDNANI